MQSILSPYISFKNNAREAMVFYQSVFGGELDLTTFKELNASVDADEEDNIMHSVLKTGNGITFMGADTPKHMEYNSGSRISMSLSGDNEMELTEYFKKLSEGGTVFMPLKKAEWGDIFGMLADKYGVQWMVNIAGAK